MNCTFLDTSFLLALVLTDDQHHQRALAWHKAIVGRLLTTEYVLMELADGLAQPNLRPIVPQLISMLRSAPEVEVVSATTALMDEGLALFSSRSDKAWGLTDCISFVVMRREGVRDALTSDHHFVQAGFHALLRVDASRA